MTHIFRGVTPIRGLEAYSLVQRSMHLDFKAQTNLLYLLCFQRKYPVDQNGVKLSKCLLAIVHALVRAFMTRFKRARASCAMDTN